MKKYRILVRGEKFYPQWRYFFTWYYFYNRLEGHDAYSEVVCNSKEEAEEFIKNVECYIIEVDLKG